MFHNSRCKYNFEGLNDHNSKIKKKKKAVVKGILFFALSGKFYCSQTLKYSCIFFKMDTWRSHSTITVIKFTWHSVPLFPLKQVNHSEGFNGNILQWQDMCFSYPLLCLFLRPQAARESSSATRNLALHIYPAVSVIAVSTHACPGWVFLGWPSNYTTTQHAARTCRWRPWGKVDQDSFHSQLSAPNPLWYEITMANRAEYVILNQLQSLINIRVVWDRVCQEILDMIKKVTKPKCVQVSVVPRDVGESDFCSCRHFACSQP